MNHLPGPLKLAGISRTIYRLLLCVCFFLISSLLIQAGRLAYIFIASNNFTGEKSYSSLRSINAQHIEETMEKEWKGREFLESRKKQRSVAPAVWQSWRSAVMPWREARPQKGQSMLPVGGWTLDRAMNLCKDAHDPWVAQKWTSASYGNWGWQQSS